MKKLFSWMLTLNMEVNNINYIFNLWIYIKAYKIFAFNGILFNHERPIRGETFVTHKTVVTLCKIKLGL